MKKLVTFLWVVCFMTTCSINLFSNDHSSASSHNPLNFSNSKSSVVQGAPCGSASGLAFFGSDEIANPSSQHCVDFSAQGFTNILTFQWTMHFDASVIRFNKSATSVVAVNLPAIDTAAIGQPAGDDLITINWPSPNFNGITIPDCEVLFQLCFDVVGQLGDSTSITFSGDETAVEIRDNQGTILTPEFFQGSVKVGDAGKPPFELSFGATSIEESMNGCVGVFANGFTNITNFKTSHTWDPAQLGYTGAQAFTLSGMTAGDFTVDASAGTLSVDWSSPNSSGETVADNTKLYEICFDALGSGGTTTQVSVTNSPVAGEATDADGDNLDVNTSSTDISIASPPGACGSINGLSFYAGAECAQPGGNVCVPVRAQDFENILSFQFSMMYDSTKFKLDSAYSTTLIPNSFSWGPHPNSQGTNLGFPGQNILGNNFTYASGTNKVITVTWVHPSFGGMTIDDCDVLFYLCFDAIGNDGDVSPLIFSDSPTPVEIADPAGNVVLNNITPFESATITVDAGCGVVPTNDLGVELGNTSVQEGAVACVPVTVTDFTDLTVFEGSVTWDNSILNFNAIQNLNLAGLTMADISVDATNGSLSFDWDSPTNDGVSVPNNTVIFEICFDAVSGAGSSTTVTLGPITATDNNGDNINSLPQNSTVTINNPPGACGSINGLSFYMGTNCVEPGEDVCVEVLAQDFENILSFQFSILYDSTLVELDTAFSNTLIPNSFGWGPHPNSQGTNLGFPGENIVGTNFNYPAGTNKIMTVTWVHPSFGGMTIADCAVLFNLCFKALGTAGSTSPIIFLDRPTPVEIADPGGNVLLNNIAPFQSGSIEIKSSCSPPPATPMVQSDDITNINCRGESTGAIDITMVGGSAGLTFSWTGPGGPYSTEDLTGLAAGTYEVTISNGTNQTTESYTVTEPSSTVTATTGNVSNVNCFGVNDGSITVNASGGTAPLSFAWVGTSQNTATITNLSAGTYRPTIMDANGCSVNLGPITITAPTSGISTQETILNVSCIGRSDGGISLATTGGTGPYSYNWPPPLVPSNTVTGLAAGNYSVVISDQNNCSINGTYTVGTRPAIVISINQITPASGTANGAIDVSVTGGSPGYSYSWSGPPSFGGTRITEDISGLEPGTYTLVVTDATGCSTTSSPITVGGNLTPPFIIDDIQVRRSCSTSNNGEILILFSGGDNPQISWTPSALNQFGFNPVGLAPGNYTFTITDNGGVVSGPTTILVEAHPALTVTASVTDETQPSNGAINATTTNGTGPYIYQWQNGPNSSMWSGIPAGIYTVDVVDNGTQCTGTGTFEVECKIPVTITQGDVTNVACNGASTGSFTLNFPTGKPDFTINVTSTALPSAFNSVETSNTFTMNNLAAGNYTIEVTDGNGTFAFFNIQITEATAFSVFDVVLPQTDDQPGEIQLTPIGGTPPFNYAWTPAALNLPNITVNSAGTYTCVITDANGCTFTTGAFDVSYFNISDAVVDESGCTGLTEGAISITVDGDAPYNYTWTDEASNTMIGDNEPVLTGLAPGQYTVEVRGASGVTITQTYTIVSSSDVVATAQVMSDFSGFNISCNGAADGSALVTVMNGQQPYQYAWSAGQSGVNSDRVDGLGAGVVTVMVTDAAGCSASAMVELTEPTAIRVNNLVSEVQCFGDDDGEIQFLTTGGVPYPTNPPYVYQWSDPAQSGSTARFLPAGNYSVTILDAHDCESIQDVTVEGPTMNLIATATSTDDNGNNTGSVRAEVIGGTQPYFYEWSVNTPDSTDRELFNLGAGDYYLTVTDANGCVSTIPTPARVLNSSIECLSTRAVITPDGAGLNEEFIIWCIEQYPQNVLEIYNRWGQLVFETEDYQNDWRGTTLRGSEVPDGAYFFVFRYVINDVTLQHRGSFTLLRE